MKMGRAVRITRAIRDWNQRELADRLGVDPSLVSLAESGRRRVSMEQFGRFSKALGCPLHILTLSAADSDTLRQCTDHDAMALGQAIIRMLSEDL